MDRFIITNVNKLELRHKNMMCKTLLFLDYDLKQTPNGVYMNLKDLKEKDKYHIYSIIKNAL